MSARWTELAFFGDLALLYGLTHSEPELQVASDWMGSRQMLLFHGIGDVSVPLTDIVSARHICAKQKAAQNAMTQNILGGSGAGVQDRNQAETAEGGSSRHHDHPA